VGRSSTPARRFWWRSAATSHRCAHGCAVELDRDACAAGEAVTGTVRGALGQARVTLERWEDHAGTARRFVVAEANPGRPGGSFALDVPIAALPSTTGDRCTLRYAAVASHEGPPASAALIVYASARPHLEMGSRLSDRLLRTWEARHFHIELATAELQGGGSVSGRVHRHGPWPAGSLEATARCIECWRNPILGPYPAPQWDAHLLWRAEQSLGIDPDAHWVPFRFEFPEDLPAAVEGRTIAWRYELLVSRTAHRWQTETAAVTPLLHEESELAPIRVTR
jgi:hypothetical protein